MFECVFDEDTLCHMPRVLPTAEEAVLGPKKQQSDSDKECSNE
jgi:hypothetical protein